jgi:hypothetical protein
MQWHPLSTRSGPTCSRAAQSTGGRRGLRSWAGQRLATANCQDYLS